MHAMEASVIPYTCILAVAICIRSEEYCAMKN